jgi:hypothetical protein
MVENGFDFALAFREELFIIKAWTRTIPESVPNQAGG